MAFVSSGVRMGMLRTQAKLNRVRDDRGDHLALRGAGMAPPVEEMKTRDVRLVVSDMIRHGRYKPIITGRKLGYQRTLSSTERDLLATSYSNGRAWAGKGWGRVRKPSGVISEIVAFP